MGESSPESSTAAPRVRWLVRAATAVVAATVALLVAEGVLRLMGIPPGDSVLLASNADLIRTPGFFKPDQSMVDRSYTALPYRIQVGSLGFRGEDFPREKPADELRIAMLGDSFTYGIYVDDTATLPVQLENRLQASCSGVRVVNIAVPGTSIPSQLEMMRRALVIAPDLVVLTVFENDLLDLLLPDWDLLARRRVQASFPRALIPTALRRSALWTLARQAVYGRRSRPMVGQNGRAAVLTREKVTSSLEAQKTAYQRDFLQLYDELRRRRIGLVMALFPSYLGVTRNVIPEFIPWVSAVAEQEGIPIVSYLEVLRAAGPPYEPLYLVPYDWHPSAKAYEIAAQRLAEYLIEHPTLGRRCGNER